MSLMDFNLNYEIRDDGIYRTSICVTDGSKLEYLVMEKEAFVDAYFKYIEPIKANVFQADMEYEKMSNKDKLLTNKISYTGKKNSMGCSEDWYDAYFAIHNTFTNQEIEQMNEQEIDNLIKLAETIQEALY